VVLIKGGDKMLEILKDMTGQSAAPFIFIKG